MPLTQTAVLAGILTGRHSAAGSGMTTAAVDTAGASDSPAGTAVPLDWQTAPEALRDALSSPRIQKAYEWAIQEAVPAVGVQFRLWRVPRNYSSTLAHRMRTPRGVETATAPANASRS